MSELDLLRSRGIGILVASAWAATLWLGGMALYLGEDNIALVLGLAVAANLGPTLMVAGRRFDGNARLVCATLAAIHPALAVYMLSGHEWQIDGHMYFFVALAALTVLCDWRAIALASGLIAVHHLLLDFVAPNWVFDGSGSFARVMVHAVAVILQFAVLGYITERLRRLTLRQTEAKLRSERLAADAMAGQAELELTLNELRDSQAREQAERDRRIAFEEEGERRRRREMAELADRFEDSVHAVVDLVGRASQDLSQAAQALRDTATQTAARTKETSAYANSSSEVARMLAGRMSDLSHSITTIASAVEQQVSLSEHAGDTAGAAHGSVRELRERAGRIVGFSDTIHGIATRTNLLALNATIEASLAGEAGRGFAVVAGEVKSLASQSETATRAIREIVVAASEGVSVADDGFERIIAAVAELSGAAKSIRDAVDRQQQTGTAIETYARDTAANAENMLSDIGAISSAAQETEMLSLRVAEAADALTGISARLRDATGEFVRKLKAA